MSETTLTLPGPLVGPGIPLRSSDILIHLIVTMLTPMFLSAAGGDLNYARMAAAETVETYCGSTLGSLIVIAKIIAFGLAALGSLGLSMEDNLPIETILRLRADAASSDRAEHRNHRLLKQTQTEPRRAPISPPPPVPAADPDPGPDEAALIAAVAETQKRTAKHLARVSAPAPQPAPPPAVATPAPAVPATAPLVLAAPSIATAKPATAPDATVPAQTTQSPAAAPAPAPPARAQSAAETENQAIWADSAARIAAETAADLPNLPPDQRHSAKLWVQVLNDFANFSLTNPRGPLPRLGDLSGMTSSKRD
jgi:hypothetical protein